MVSSVVAPIAARLIGLATRPSRSTTTTTAGIGGAMAHLKRPAASVFTVPRCPTTVISAPMIGAEVVASTRRPSTGVAGSEIAIIVRSASIAGRGSMRG